GPTVRSRAATAAARSAASSTGPAGAPCSSRTRSRPAPPPVETAATSTPPILTGTSDKTVPRLSTGQPVVHRLRPTPPPGPGHEGRWLWVVPPRRVGAGSGPEAGAAVGGPGLQSAGHSGWDATGRRLGGCRATLRHDQSPDLGAGHRLGYGRRAGIDHLT